MRNKDITNVNYTNSIYCLLINVLFLHQNINIKDMNGYTLKWLLMIMMYCTSLIFVSCEKDSKDWSETAFLLVSAEKGKYYPFGSDQELDGLNIRREGESVWSVIPLTGIEKFNYEEGFNYRLKVEIIHLKNPSQDDSSIKYKLIEIISKEKVLTN